MGTLADKPQNRADGRSSSLPASEGGMQPISSSQEIPDSKQLARSNDTMTMPNVSNHSTSRRASGSASDTIATPIDQAGPQNNT